MAKLFANCGYPDQTSSSVASDLGLHCLPVTCMRVSRLRWVNSITYYRDQTWFFMHWKACWPWLCLLNLLHKWKYLQAWHLDLFSMTRAEGRGFQHLPRDLANVNALKNHVWSLLLHKNWEHLLHFALFLALFCFAFSPMSRERNFHWLCSF